MGGRASRQKGIRNEYVLRDYLRNLGYEAVRVPLSGASEGFKGDVIARKDGIEYTFEMKARRDAFKRIYHVYSQMLLQDASVVRFTIDQTSIAMGTSFEEVKKPNGTFPKLIFAWESILKQNTRTFSKIFNLRKLLGESEYLVIRDNNRPMLFLRYWG